MLLAAIDVDIDVRSPACGPVDTMSLSSRDTDDYRRDAAREPDHDRGNDRDNRTALGLNWGCAQHPTHEESTD